MITRLKNRCALIVTALPQEYVAVRSHLSELREIVHRGTVYETGRFLSSDQEPWDIIIAEIGPGNNRAASETERAISYFRPKIAMFVGIAGGIKDVKLYDVVAATKVYGYESGKQDEIFSTRPELGQSSYSLLQRARAEAKKAEWLKRLAIHLDHPPKVLIKPIAAGEKVLANRKSSLFKFLKKHYSDAVAVEMEGRGFLEAIDADESVLGIVIRGISDLIDHKASSDKRGSQEYASQTASAFALQLLATFSPAVELLKSSKGSSHSQSLPDIPQRRGMSHKQKTEYRIILISPGIESPFYTEVLECLATHFGCVPDIDFHLTPLLPSKSFNSIELWGMLEKIKTKRIHADAVILIPDYPDQHFASIQDFMRVRNDIPFVLFDVLFDIARLGDLTADTTPLFVGGDDLQGGNVAANIALAHLVQHNVKSPLNVLVLTGADTAWENNRNLGFQQSLLKQYPDTQIIESPPLKYSRQAAYEFCIAKFDGYRLLSIPFDIIFACNDNMALGARSAWIQARRRGFHFQAHLGIIGYDGVTEMRWSLRDSDPILIGTVDVNISLQTSLVVEAIRSFYVADGSHSLINRSQRVNIQTLGDHKIQLVRPSALLAARNL